MFLYQSEMRNLGQKKIIQGLLQHLHYGIHPFRLCVSRYSEEMGRNEPRDWGIEMRFLARIEDWIGKFGPKINWIELGTNMSSSYPQKSFQKRINRAFLE